MTGYMIGPDVTMQLVDDEAVILTSDPGSGAFPVRRLLPFLCQAVHRGEVPSSAAEPGVFGTYGKKEIY
jgi:hypothetical protein